MAVYEIGGDRFEVPDNVQGAQLEQTLTQISESMAPAEQPQNKGGAELAQRGDMLPGIKQSIEQNQGMARQQDVNIYKQPEREKLAQDSVEFNTLKEVAQGATFGFSDELAAGAASLLAAGLDDADFFAAYEDILPRIQEEQRNFRADEPGIAIGAQALGGLTTGGLGLQKVMAQQAGKSLLSRAGTAMAVGGTQGGIAGAGFAEPGERAEGAAKGAGVGVVAAPIVMGLNNVPSKIVGAFQRKQDAAQKVTGILNNRVKGDYSDAGETAAVGFKLNHKGKVVPDLAQRNAQRYAIDDGTIAMAGGSSPADKKKYLQMLRIHEKGAGNPRYKTLVNSESVVGNSLKKRTDFLWQANKEAGKRVGAEVKKLGDSPADFSNAVNKFESDLGGIGVTLKQLDDGRIVPNFDGSIIDVNSGAKKAIKDVVKHMNNPATSARSGHDLKKVLDEVVTFGKMKTGLAGEGERVLKSFRHNINKTLGDTFPSYKEANKVYSETIGLLDDVQSVVGNKVDFTVGAENAEQIMGRIAKGIMSNNRSKQLTLNMLENVDKGVKGLLSKNIGGKKLISMDGGKFASQFDDDLINQSVFSDQIQKRFGVEANTSLAGEVAKGATDAVRGDTIGAMGEVIKGVNKKLNPKDNAAAYKALRAIVNGK